MSERCRPAKFDVSQAFPLGARNRSVHLFTQKETNYPEPGYLLPSASVGASDAEFFHLVVETLPVDSSVIRRVAQVPIAML